ncbi:MAG: phosphopyruvate hydratase [Pirellulales bacterium]
MTIKHVDAWQVFDSRGNPTVEAEVILDDGGVGRAMVPSGASTGSHEAWELRDHDQNRFGGKSVHRAVDNIRREIAPALKGYDVFDQAAIDAQLIELDGTANKSRLGANAILGVSMACCVAAANSRRQPLFEYLGQGHGTLLPLPEIQIIGGGVHASRVIDLQDFMIIAIGAKNYAETLEITSNVYHAAGNLLRESNRLVGVADEGGFWPVVTSNEAVIEFVQRAIERAGYVPGVDVALSLDVAATELFRDGKYHFPSEGRSFSTDEFIKLILEWVRDYPIISIEDPLAEDDWQGWQRITAAIGSKVQLIGDDLFTTNLQRIERGISLDAANAVLIKLNQVGTVSETIASIRRTQEAGWLPIVSARSGETEDTFIAHLAVAQNTGQLKVGSFSRSERMAKWNELLRIERLLGDRARFVGSEIFRRSRP